MVAVLNNGIRILIVDDEEPIRIMVSSLVSMMGANPVAASNGKEALELFQQNQFDLVITDLDMPEIDGLTLASSIKENSPRTPIVMITGNETAHLEIDHVDFVVFKPFGRAEFESTIRSFL